MDNRDYIKVLLYSYYTTIIGWGVLLTNGYRINWSTSDSSSNNDHNNKNTATSSTRRVLGFMVFGFRLSDYSK